MNKLTTKVADKLWELEEICRLNHQIFSEEILQHATTANGLLIDKFHSENKYVICLNDREVVGMIALRAIRPFSLDSKLENIDSYLPPNKSLCEIRLLAVKPNYRKTQAFYYLYKRAFSEFIKSDYDYAVMSGILSQQKLYKNIGFVPFGPLVGDEVKFQPMYSSPDYFFKSKHKQSALSSQNQNINLLPGPVNIKSVIKEEFNNSPVSHRSSNFKYNYTRISNNLCQFVCSKNVQLLTGTGTLANEVMLAHLSTMSEKGLVLSNGEFGNRISHQASCHKLDFIEYKINSGEEFNSDELNSILTKNKIDWIFFVHCETSTGILNNLDDITKECHSKGIRVIVDCISTFGIIPIDLSKVYMASASSGKAIGSYSGLSMVFFNELSESIKNEIPVYLDIRNYIRKGSIPFTLNSNALYALGASLELINIDSRYKKIRVAGEVFRKRISALGLNLITSKNLHPAIITLKLPDTIDSLIIGETLEEKKIFVNYKSDYLINSNTIQICLFSDLDLEEIQYVSNSLQSILEIERINKVI